jgi:hypothetical protein
MVFSRLVSTSRCSCLTLLAVTVASGALAAEEPASTIVDQQLIESALERAGDNRPQIQRALDAVPEEQRDAMRFLIAYMPDRDAKNLSADFLLKNVDLAYQAREATTWGKQIPEDIFFNDVLPYASVNERRDDWRADFFARFLPLVAECRTPGEAAQVLNREMFKLLDVQYHARKRPKPDQSPLESIEAKYASCSGLYILLIDACRAVCVPARFAGTPRWTTKRGNHSWVEIWDARWHCTGACEYDPAGLDNAWFLADASQALKDDPRHAIYASSWRTTGTPFPLVWDRRAQYVQAVNVTDRYTETSAEPATKDEVLVGIEVWDRPGGERAVSDLVIRSGEVTVHEGRTTGPSDDANHLLEVKLAPETEYQIEFTPAGGNAQTQTYRTTKEARQRLHLLIATEDATTASAEQSAKDSAAALVELHAYLSQPRAERPSLKDQEFLRIPLSKADAALAADQLWNDHVEWIRETRAAEMEQRQITVEEFDDKPLKFHYEVFGEKPEGGRSLYISMHGGGNAPARVNDRQWENQKTLYEPAEGVYLAPRAPTNTWNLWHEPHIDALFDRLIENLVVFEDVNPDRVYVMGYSAGGDGVFQLAPRMADRFAAAAMMAGHPNETSPLGLRNIGFALHVGGRDRAYNRNEVAREWKQELEKLHTLDPGGYRHQVVIHEDKAHWMDREDAAALPWMAERIRDPRPQRIVWKQDDVTHTRLYWLAVDTEHQKAGALIRADRSGQTIDIESTDVDSVTVLLDDELADLDQPVTIKLNGSERFSGRPERTIGGLVQSLSERADRRALYPARVTIGP